MIQRRWRKRQEFVEQEDINFAKMWGVIGSNPRLVAKFNTYYKVKLRYPDFQKQGPNVTIQNAVLEFFKQKLSN